MTGAIDVRLAVSADQSACEHLVRDAFWDVYRPGCHEHFPWHLAMDGHPDVIDPLTMVAVSQGEVVGCIMSTQAHVISPGDSALAVLAVGPIAVAPSRQRQGVGSMLLRTTLALAPDLGYTAVLLLGDPDYYSRFGFSDAARSQITTAEGHNFPDFMAQELGHGKPCGQRRPSGRELVVRRLPWRGRRVRRILSRAGQGGPSGQRLGLTEPSLP